VRVDLFCSVCVESRGVKSIFFETAEGLEACCYQGRSACWFGTWGLSDTKLALIEEAVVSTHCRAVELSVS